jgi:hypothetical protein
MGKYRKLMFLLAVALTVKRRAIYRSLLVLLAVSLTLMSVAFLVAAVWIVVAGPDFFEH